MKISVIIPVFNAENYVTQSVESVKCQSYSDMEIIIINDGSTDNSLKICSKLAITDYRIKIINQSNKGAAAARNAGIAQASGSYIIFLDADDIWLDRDGIQKLVLMLKENPQADFLVFLHAILSKAGIKSKESFSNYNLPLSQNKNEILRHLIRNNQFVSSAWIQIIKLSFLKNNDLYFEAGLYCEDLDWILRLWEKAQKVKFINLRFYGYRRYQASFSNKHLIKQTRDNINIIERWVDRDLDIAFKMAILPFLSECLSSLYKNFIFTNKTFKNEIETKLKSLSFLLQYSSNKKAIRVYSTYKIFGFKISVTAWGLYTFFKKRLLSVSRG